MRIRAHTFAFCVNTALVLAMSTAVHAQIYRWTNDSGSVTYSNTPPPDAIAKDVAREDAVRGPAQAAPALLPELPRERGDRELQFDSRNAARPERDTERPTATLRDSVTVPGSAAREGVGASPSSIAERNADSAPMQREAIKTEPATVMPDSAKPAAASVRELEPITPPAMAREMETPPAAKTVREARPITPPAIAREIEAPPAAKTLREPQPSTPAEVARDLTPPPLQESERTRRSAREVEPPTRLFSAPREPDAPAKTSSVGDTDRQAESSVKETEKPQKSTRAKSDANRKPRLKANLPEAVQDPCLRSSDPKCYEKQKNAYVPYRGYSPSTAQDTATDSAAPVTPVGSTSTAPAGGTVQGGSKAKVTPPKASDYALPPGSETSSRKPARK